MLGNIQNAIAVLENACFKAAPRLSEQFSPDPIADSPEPSAGSRHIAAPHPSAALLEISTRSLDQIANYDEPSAEFHASAGAASDPSAELDEINIRSPVARNVLTKKKIKRMERRMNMKYPLLQENETLEQFEKRCDRFIKMYDVYKRATKKRKEHVPIEAAEQPFLETPSNKTHRADVPHLRAKSLSPVEDSTPAPDYCDDMLKTPEGSPIAARMASKDPRADAEDPKKPVKIEPDAPVKKRVGRPRKDGGVPGGPYEKKNVSERRSRKKDATVDKTFADAQTQTADLPQRLRVELERLNREMLLYSPPVVRVVVEAPPRPKRIYRKKQKKTEVDN